MLELGTSIRELALRTTRRAFLLALQFAESLLRDQRATPEGGELVTKVPNERLELAKCEHFRLNAV
ncbi:MAG TPA: hypothetical protein VM033_03795 [Gemmatimonadaceae bacterium]|nr:hypothetical protein [Gemmatimonadaceae bacterium]